MMPRLLPIRSVPVLVLSMALSLCASRAAADVTLPNVFGSNMVLQRGRELPVWGRADPGEEVTVRLADQRASTTADDNGRWRVTLPALDAGGPHEMTVEGENTIALENVLVGEVWVCSGQSNMEWPVNRAENAEQEIQAAKYPEIRLFHIPRKPAATPQQDVEAEWQACSSETVPGFSAVGYFFGRHLHKELNVPVGLIESAWGGTRIEPWTPPAGFQSVPALEDIADRLEDLPAQGADGGINHQSPTALYNGMIAPIVPFTVRGAIWYQGEANLRDGLRYHAMMKGLIRGWRQVWDQGDFPFYYVQLAPYRYNGDPHRLPEIWQAQRQTLSVPNTGMAVTTDIGNLDDIHPRNKQDVGKRLALWALAETYGRDGIVYSGPLVKSVTAEDGKLRIRFEHADGGLSSRDGKPLSRFEVAGPDGEFVPAEAAIDGKTVVVGSEEVPEPTAVRFGWHQEAQPNLVNEAGLPASPFRAEASPSGQ